MFSVTWINGTSLGAVSTPKAEYAATLLYALRAFGFKTRVWRDGQIIA